MLRIPPFQCKAIHKKRERPHSEEAGRRVQSLWASSPLDPVSRAQACTTKGRPSTGIPCYGALTAHVLERHLESPRGGISGRGTAQ
jgi:hypothetical protein